MHYGYARVSTVGQAVKGNSLEYQEKELMEAKAEKVYVDTYTGTKMERPQFDLLLKELKAGDTLIVTKLDRIARTATDGYELIKELLNSGVKVHVLNMGLLDNSPTGDLILHIFLAFAEFERQMIVQRTAEGREMAKENGVVFGRKKKFSTSQLDLAMALLNEHSYNEVARMTGISKSTLIRESAKRRG